MNDNYRNIFQERMLCFEVIFLKFLNVILIDPFILKI